MINADGIDAVPGIGTGSVSSSTLPGKPRMQRNVRSCS